MKNITISVDEAVARWARIWAAKNGTSVSKMLGRLLREAMEAERGYRGAMAREFARGPIVLKEPGQSYPGREELHDRAGLR